MDIKVIAETRDLLIPCTTFGTTLEDNATELHFIISDKLNELKDKNLIIVNSAGSFKLPLDSNNSVMLDSIVTYDEVAAIQLVLSDSVKKMWRSKSYEITLYSSLDSSGRNPISDSVKEAQKEYRQQLAQAVSTFYGEDYTEYEWNDLIFSVASAVALNAEPVTVKSKWGEQKILPPEGKNSFSEVIVEPLQPRHETFTYNGTWIVSDDPETDGYWTSVTVDVPIKQPHLTDITVSPDIITRTYDKLATEEPSIEPFDGINRVTVKAVDSSIDSDIVPENIREGKTILGVTGNIVPLEGELADKVSNYNALTNAFRQATTAPSLITGGYNLDKDENEGDILIKLPYLYTPNAIYNENTPISNSVVECGFDVSASGDSISHYNEVSMFNQPNRSQNLKKLKLTGFECIAYGTAIFSNLFGSLSNLVELTLEEGNNYRDEYSEGYYSGFFFRCAKLEAILGTPLDMSRGTTYRSMFYNCESLRYVRFKPGTICHDLDLSDCHALIKKYEATTDDPGTLLSIINGVRDYTGAEDPITIKFSAFVKSFLSSWRCTIDEQTGLYVYSDKNSDFTMWSVLTNLKGVVIS